MKFLCSIVFVVSIIGQIDSGDAIKNLRKKRTLAQEYCPDSISNDDCAAYAEKESKARNYCHRYYITGNHIEWQSCGRAICGKNTRLVDEDKSKAYPDCCSHCEVIDPTKPAEYSAVM